MVSLSYVTSSRKLCTYVLFWIYNSIIISKLAFMNMQHINFYSINQTRMCLFSRTHAINNLISCLSLFQWGAFEQYLKKRWWGNHIYGNEVLRSAFYIKNGSFGGLECICSRAYFLIDHYTLFFWGT